MMNAERPAKLWTAGAYREEDVPGLLALIQSYYGNIDTTSEAFFRWQYEANPSGKVLLWVARHKDTGAVMGQHVLLPMGASVHGKDLPAVLSFNALVDPTYHKQGIWSGLGDACGEAAVQQGIAFSYGIPNPNSRVPMVKRLKYHDLGEVELLVHVAKPGPLAKVLPSWARGIGALGLSAVRPLLFKRRRPKAEDFEVVSISKFDERFDALYTQFRKRYPVMIRRDAPHLNWRYTGVPGRSYRMWAAVRGDQVLAYAVFRFTEFREVASGMLLDLAGAGPDCNDAELAVVNAGLDALAQEGAAAFFAYMVPGTSEASLLRRAGFRKPPQALKPQPFPLLVLPIADDPKLAPTVNLNQWYFTLGDYDVF